MSDMIGFEQFYSAIYGGRAPFPWQSRLAALLGSGEPWPTEIGVPTGLGKTSCLDVAVWWLASQADHPPRDRVAPTRIWWLVNRRLLIDATATHAQRVAECLDDPATVVDSFDDSGRAVDAVTALEVVATRLSSLSARPDAPALEVVRLRGGVATGRPTDPSQPAVLLTTLPMYGSRLLFRGYGSSRSMRPIDAALAGSDSLILVDEAHLVRHLVELFEPLAECESPETMVLPTERVRPTVVSLTATGRVSERGRFDLDDDDLAHQVVEQRLNARKLVTVIEHKPTKPLGKVLAETAATTIGERERPTSCVVFANTPGTAREAVEYLNKRLAAESRPYDLVLLTGRMRDRESDRARRAILDPVSGVPAGRRADTRSRTLVVVATQTLEVGADVDFELGVTEACGVRALTQRLGRVNRLGTFDDSHVEYIHLPPKPRKGTSASWPVYGEEPTTVLERLRAAADGAEPVDLSPANIGGVLGDPADDPGPAPEIMPALLWEWVKTTTPPPDEAPVEPYFEGLAEPDRRLGVCWRAYLPPGDGVVWPRVSDDEIVDIPIAEFVDSLDKGSGGEETVSEVARLTTDRATVEVVPTGRLRPGDVVILGCDAGMLDQHGWNPDSAVPVVDVSVPRHGIPLEAAALERLTGQTWSEELDALVAPTDDNDTPESERLATLLGALAVVDAVAIPVDEWHALVADLDLDRGLVAPVGEIPRLVRRGSEPEPHVDAFDELSLSDSAVNLTKHGDGVGRRSRLVAESVGLPADALDAVEFAGRFHDVGKADARFQRWLDPEAVADRLVAKSARPRSRWRADRIAAGWPSGGRHEILSERLVAEWARSLIDADNGSAPDIDLIRHLVVSHHGHGRPFTIPVDDDTACEVSFALDGAEVRADADLSISDWEQPDRFRRLSGRYGFWGLALIEAIVRQSDHAVSAGGWTGGVGVI